MNIPKLSMYKDDELLLSIPLDIGDGIETWSDFVTGCGNIKWFSVFRFLSSEAEKCKEYIGQELKCKIALDGIMSMNFRFNGVIKYIANNVINFDITDCIGWVKQK